MEKMNRTKKTLNYISTFLLFVLFFMIIVFSYMTISNFSDLGIEVPFETILLIMILFCIFVLIFIVALNVSQSEEIVK